MKKVEMYLWLFFVVMFILTIFMLFYLNNKIIQVVYSTMLGYSIGLLVRYYKSE